MSSTLITITYFTAPWCAPCKQLLPRVSKIAEAVGAAIDVVDIDTRPDEASEAGIRAVPTVVIRAGDEQAVLAGGMATPMAVRAQIEEFQSLSEAVA